MWKQVLLSDLHQTLFLNLFLWFFSKTPTVSSCAWANQYPAEYSRGILWGSQSSLPSTTLSGNSSPQALVSLGLLALGPQLWESARILLSSPSLLCDLEAFKALSWGRYRAHLICWPYLRITVLIAWCVFLFCLFWFFLAGRVGSCFRWETKSSSYNSILAKRSW